MKVENSQKLISEFPELYSKNFEFDCDDGWFDMLYNLSKFLHFQTTRNSHIYSKIKVQQVKQKFAGLRFYVEHLDEEKERLQSAIDFAEYFSFNICEKCGSSDNVQKTKSGYIRSLCENCRIWRNNE